MLKRLLLLLIVLFFAWACAPPAIKTTALVPATYHDAAKLKEVAVLPFDGIGGRELSSEIEATLASINIGDKQYFTLVDRTRLDQLINEMKLSQSALIDPNTATQLGKLVGAKGIYTGVITASVARDSHYRENRSECVQKEIKYDKKGRAYEGACIRWNRYTVLCTKREATFSFTPKLIEVETGRIVYSNNISVPMYSRSCEDSSSPLANASELIGLAKQFALAKFRKHVAPYYITFEIKLMDSTEGITSKEAEKKFEQGTDFAKHNRFDRACELWGEARILSPNSVSILYNLGICSEVTGELEQALDLYNKADKLLNKPDENITQALRRISASVKERKKLQEQMKDEKIETKNEQVEKDKNIEPESTDKPTEKKRRRVK